MLFRVLQMLCAASLIVLPLNIVLPLDIGSSYAASHKKSVRGTASSKAKRSARKKNKNRHKKQRRYAKADTTAPVFGKWQLLCKDKQALEPAKRCRISQTVLSRTPGGGRQLLLIRVFKGKPLIAMVTTPHSIFLKPGLILKIDKNKSRVYSFETCNEDGCHTGIVLGERMIEEMSDGKLGLFYFFDGGQRRITVPVSLNGFKSALSAMMKP